MPDTLDEVMAAVKGAPVAPGSIMHEGDFAPPSLDDVMAKVTAKPGDLDAVMAEVRKPNSTILDIPGGLAEGVASGSRSIASGITSAASALGDIAMAPFGGRTQPDPLQPVTEAIRPGPMEPGSGLRDAMRFAGSAAPWIAEGVLAPELLIPTAGTAGFGGGYQQAKESGLGLRRSVGAGMLSGGVDALTFDLLGPYMKAIGSRVGQPFMQMALKAAAAGSVGEAQGILHRAIDQGTRGEELNHLFGSGEDAGKMALFQFAMDAIAHTVAGMPKGNVRDLTGGLPTNDTNLTGTPSGPDQGALPAREGQGVALVPEMQPGATSGAGEQPVGAGTGVSEPGAAEGGAAGPGQHGEVADTGAGVGADVGGAQSVVEPARGVTEPQNKASAFIQEAEGLRRTGDRLGDLDVHSDIPNTDSISSSFDKYEVLPGVRSVPLEGWNLSPSKTFAAADDIAHVEKLAAQIKQNGYIKPLIIAYGEKGPYILEGVHRASALHELGYKEMPAVVVLDQRLIDAAKTNPARVAPEPDPTRIPNEGESTPSATSVKNRIVDEQRVARGLEPLMGEAARQDQTVWDAAMKKIDADPEIGRRLVAELNDKPRTLSDTDNAILDHERVTVSNDYDLMNRAVNEAKAAGDDARVAELEPRLASLRDYFDQVDTAGKAGGRESARGFRFRQLLVDDQYNLLPMERAKSAALGGRELTPEERAHVSELSDRIKRLEQAVSEQEKSAQEAKPKRQAKILSFLDSQADEARARLKSRMFRASSNPFLDPTFYTDLAIVGARHIAHGIADFAEWSKKMADEFGDEIKPHLDAIYAKAKEHIDAASRNAALAESKKRVGAENADLEAKIAAGEKLEPKKRTAETDAELLALRKRNRELKSLLASGKEDAIVSDAEKQARSLKRQIAQLENKQAAGDTSKRGVKQGPDTAEVAALKEKRRALLQEVADYRSSRETKQTPDERYQKTQGKRTAEFQRKAAEKDFAPAERAQRELSSESLAAKAEAEKAKQEFQQELRKDQIARRTPLEKVQDTFVKWRRGFLLSSPTTLAKLTSAAAERIGLTPLEEAVGAGIGKLAPKLAERAPREGGASVKAEAAAITEGFTKGMADAKQTLKTGKSDLDLLYGKPNSLPPEAIDFLGHIHGALKAPVKRAEFARSFEKRTQWSIANGLDVTNPILQTNIALDAYKDANRSIFLQDNRVVDAYNQVVRTFEQPNKATGKPSALGKAGATVAKTLLPIVKVPTNIVSETFATAGGLPAGIVKVLRTGAENMSAAEADQTMRWLKKGALGAAALYIGYSNPQMFGGYYQPGKRDEKDVNFGSVRLGAVDVPSMLVHNPLLEVFQLGATVRRVTDSKLRKKDEDTQGLGAGAVAGTLGLLEETPFIREPLEIGKVFDPAQRTSALGRNAESLLIPSGVQWLARQTDLDAQGNPVKRAPATVMQNVQEGIPGLRKNLPVKKGSPQPVTVQK